jgi:hypothetical protein
MDYAVELYGTGFYVVLMLGVLVMYISVLGSIDY